MEPEPKLTKLRYLSVDWFFRIILSLGVENPYQ